MQTQVIHAALGGVLTPDHMAEGFMLLANGDLPNGSGITPLDAPPSNPRATTTAITT